jgi:ATP-binding cassette, subfamily F, member 3
MGSVGSMRGRVLCPYTCTYDCFVVEVDEETRYDWFVAWTALRNDTGRMISHVTSSFFSFPWLYLLCAGKSTLLRRLAAREVPGMPHDMKVFLVEQHQDVDRIDESAAAADPRSIHAPQLATALETLMRADAYRTWLLQEQEKIETELERDTNLSTDELQSTIERLGDVSAELDAIGADTAEIRAQEILRGLQFTEEMIHGPVGRLSGGWRMRLTLAGALFVSDADLICLDECTNPLDLIGLDWLIRFLNSSDKTVICVSHDRMFLNAICTDIVVMEHQRLSYHAGSFSVYEHQQREKTARESQILDAADRQRSRAQAFVQKQQGMANRKAADPNKQRQARMIREKKLERIGNYREDGKRYKLRSLKTLDEKSVRLAQKVHIEEDEPVIQMSFPNPAWPLSINVGDTIIRLEDLSFSYGDRTILRDVTLSLSRGSKAAFVGNNGSGAFCFVFAVPEF